VKEMFKTVNEMLGDIVKVTPSSKAVGDMAIFMVQNNLTPDNIYEKAKDLDFPDSIVAYFEGMMGQPEGGFPERLSKLILKGREPIKCRPGELLPPEDFDSIKKMLVKNTIPAIVSIKRPQPIISTKSLAFFITLAMTTTSHIQ
jgi:pyruvate carboxylase